MDDFLGVLVKPVAWLFGLVLVVSAIWFMGFLIGARLTYDEGLERGYIVYCQHDGSRRWVGECE